MTATSLLSLIIVCTHKLYFMSLWFHAWKISRVRPSAETALWATIKTFRQTPCLWQLEVMAAILKQDKDVILIAATGSGKTLTFWMPLLINTKGIQIICAPLNILGAINVHELAKYSIPAITVTAENASVATFQVSNKIECLGVQLTDIPTRILPISSILSSWWILRPWWNIIGALQACGKITYSQTGLSEWPSMKVIVLANGQASNRIIKMWRGYGTFFRTVSTSTLYPQLCQLLFSAT